MGNDMGVTPTSAQEGQTAGYARTPRKPSDNAQCPDCGGRVVFWPMTGDYICQAPWPYLDPVNGCSRGSLSPDEVIRAETHKVPCVNCDRADHDVTIVGTGDCCDDCAHPDLECDCDACVAAYGQRSEVAESNALALRRIAGQHSRDMARCGANKPFMSTLNACALPAGHDGHHRYWDGRPIESGFA